MRLRSHHGVVPLVLLAVLSVPGFSGSAERIGDHTRVAFVTSTSGSPIFAEWAEADKGSSGLAAADSICVNLATSAGLDNPERFIAWLSDDDDDAYCRIHGEGGKKSNNCDLKALPEGAGPWVRTDGTPWAADVAAMLDNKVVYSPLRFDQDGNPVGIAGQSTWTATNADGTLFGSSCTNWTARPSELTYYGLLARTGSQWTLYDTLNCTLGFRHLYCLEKTAGPALELPEPPGRLAFVAPASGGFKGDLGAEIADNPGIEGLEAGDWLCNHEAQIRHLPGAGGYKAWLSGANTDARDRFLTDGPWYRPDGLLVANNMVDLIDGELFSPINQTANGTYLGSTSDNSNRIWTGTTASGTRHTNTCDSWTDATSGFFGKFGRISSVDLRWTEDNAAGASCSAFDWPLYCLSDWEIGRFYENGFEF